VPEHSIKGDSIPSRLNQVAFWVVRRNVSAQFSARQFTPIAVLIRPDQDCIMGRMPGMQQWVPYPELLRRLSGRERGDETPQWWAPDEDDEDEAGLSRGLWVPPGPEDDRRVFYATGAKGVSHQHSSPDDAKLTGHETAEAPDGGSPAWNPTLLEITIAGCAAGDRPVDWAMWAQQQRFPDHYRDEGLKLPLVLHLAAKATEYALPQEYAETRLLEDAPEGDVADGDDATDDGSETGGALALADDEEAA